MAAIILKPRFGLACAGLRLTGRHTGRRLADRCCGNARPLPVGASPFVGTAVGWQRAIGPVATGRSQPASWYPEEGKGVARLGLRDPPDYDD